MTPYIPRQRIERRASALWETHSLSPGFDVDVLLDAMDLAVLWQKIPLSHGRRVAAELVPEERLVLMDETVPMLRDNMGFYRFTIAHEIGHWELHAEPVRADNLVISDVAPEQFLCFDGPGEVPQSTRDDIGRREHQANLFATYLLAPQSVFLQALRLHGCDGWQATRALADSLGLSVAATLVRLHEEKLGHRDDSGVPRPGPEQAAGQQRLW